MMQTSGTKRRVSTCIPCYNHKQKCNRRYPCNHCTRRRRPEECVYRSNPAAHLPNTRPAPNESPSQSSGKKLKPSQEADAPVVVPFKAESQGRHGYARRPSLLESFGYSEDSNSNTMALLKTWESSGVYDAPNSEKTALPCIMDSVQRDLDRMPTRAILDFLVQYFVCELDWMKQLIHAPSFLRRYQQWWLKERPLATADIEFAVLVLRICLYAACFLSSPSHAPDQRFPTPLPEICTICSEVADSLAKVCVSLDWRGSLVRVQHLLFAATKSFCEGRTDKYWEGVASASQAAQKAGIHRDFPPSGHQSWDMENEMRRRVLCNLYILDSHLARQLDRVPFLPDNLIDDRLPRMNLAIDVDVRDIESGAPEMFTERLMQLQLAKFWRISAPGRNSESYDPTQAEQRYEKFCSEYLPSLPPAFALKPTTTWDKPLPRLTKQRYLLHIYIFDSICWNFRPLLLLQPYQIAALPPYKRVLLRSQKKVLANAALRELDAVSALHSSFTGGRTHFSPIIFNTFEASVLLLTLCTHEDFPFDEEGEGEEEYDHDESAHLSFGSKAGQTSRKRIIQAAEKGLSRLQMLAEVSDMAAAGARTIAQLFLGVSKSVDVDSSLPSPWTMPSLDLGGLTFDTSHAAFSSESEPSLGTGKSSALAPEDWDFDRELLDLDLMLPNDYPAGWPAPIDKSWNYIKN